MSETKKTKAPAEPEAEATVAENATVPEAEAPAGAVKPAEPSGDDYVDYMAPLLPGKVQKDIFCAVNGETVLIKRGVPVKVKRKFEEALNNAAAQQYAAYQTMTDIRKQGDKPAGNM